MTDEGNGKVALVTGGSGALGTAVVSALESNGYEVCRGSRDRSDAKLEWFDVTDTEQVNEAVAQIIEQYGRIDVLANLVGGWNVQPPITETSDEDLDRFINLNLMSAFKVSRAAAPHMVRNGWGRIINIGAKPGERGGAGNGPYGISKAGVLILTDTMAEELKGTGVTVNALIPSIIDTAPNREGMPDADFSTWVPPEHLAGTLLFLCSDEAASITGERIHVLNRA